MAGPEKPDDPDPDRRPRKDRLIQTRVPRDLEATLKQEAQRRRLTVSHLIRNVLEDAFDLVDDVVADVDQIVSDSVHLAKNVTRNARRLAGSARSSESPEPPASQESHEPPPEPVASQDDDPLSHVYAWNEVVLHRDASCSRCGCEIARGERGFVGMSEAPATSRAWLCHDCIASL